MHSLTRGEQKSLAYHQVVAKKLRDDPTLLTVARDRLRWYRQRNPAGLFYYKQWDRLLDGPIEVLMLAMTSASQESCALRQENPFVDLMTQPERAAVYRRVAEEIDAGSRS